MTAAKRIFDDSGRGWSGDEPAKRIDTGDVGRATRTAVESRASPGEASARFTLDSELKAERRPGCNSHRSGMNVGVQLSLFYVRVPPRPGSPESLATAAVILYGEGSVFRRQDKIKSRSKQRSLGKGLRLREITGDFAGISQTLQNEFYDEGAERILLGRVRRPEILGLPPTARDLRAPPKPQHISRIHQFVAPDKTAILEPLLEGLGTQAQQIVDALSKMVRLRLADDDACFLGDIFIADQPLAPMPDFRLSSHNHGRRIVAELEPGLDPADVTVNLRLYGTDQLPIGDHLLQLPSSRVVQVDANQAMVGVHLRAWHEGELFYDAYTPFLLQIKFALEVPGTRLRVLDKLTQRVERAVQAGVASTSTLSAVRDVQQTSIESSSQGASPTDPWRSNKQTARVEAMNFIAPSPPAGTYFPAGGEGRGAAVTEIATLITGASSATVVDPFFDAHGAGALLPRIAGRQVRVTVITSLPLDVVPDDAVPKLKRFMLSAGPALPSGLSVLRCTKSNGGQSFHDRFLVLRYDSKEPRVFALTNSLSGAAADYSLVMIELPLGTGAAVVAEFDQLLSRESVHSETLWPTSNEDSPPPVPHASWQFPDWRRYLSRLVPRWLRSEDVWLRLAGKSGALTIQPDGAIGWSVDGPSIEIAQRVMPRSSLAARLCTARLPFGVPRFVLDHAWHPARAVASIGHAQARGLDVSTQDIVTCLPAHSSDCIETYLHDQRHTWAPKSEADRSVAELLKVYEPSLELARSAFTLWGNTEGARDLGVREYGTKFSAAVLASSSPDQYCKLVERTRDVRLIAGILDASLVQDPFPPNLARAMLASSSALLRALAAQSHARPMDRWNFEHRHGAPLDTDRTLDWCRTGGISNRELALFACTWAQATSEEPKQKALAKAVVASGPLPDETLDELAQGVLASPPTFLVGVAAATGAGRAPGSGLLRAITRRFAKTLVEDEEGRSVDSYFLSRLEAASRAVATICSLDGDLPSQFIQSALDLKELAKNARRLSPFRRQIGASRAILALGNALLWRLRSAQHVSPGLSLAEIEATRTFLDNYPDAPRELRIELRAQAWI